MDGEELHLTPIEYKLLCLLAHNADKVLTHQFILHEIWGTATKSDLASLRVRPRASALYPNARGYRLPTGHPRVGRHPPSHYELR